MWSPLVRLTEWWEGEEGDEWEPWGCYVVLLALVVVILVSTWVLAFYVSGLFTTGGQR